MTNFCSLPITATGYTVDTHGQLTMQQSQHNHQSHGTESRVKRVSLTPSVRGGGVKAKSLTLPIIHADFLSLVEQHIFSPKMHQSAGLLQIITNFLGVQSQITMVKGVHLLSSQAMLSPIFLICCHQRSQITSNRLGLPKQWMSH